MQMISWNTHLKEITVTTDSFDCISLRKEVIRAEELKFEMFNALNSTE